MFEEKLRVIDSDTYDGVSFEILEITRLDGGVNEQQLMSIFLMNQTNVKPKLIRIKLNNSKVITEAGSLYYLKGNIISDTHIGSVGEIAKKLFKKMVTKETMFNPTYEGTGEIYLEPRIGHFALVKLNNESIIVDKGMFYCATKDIKVSPYMQDDISTGLWGGEGYFQTKIEGTGLVVLEIPVPLDEIQMIKLNNETLQVDGNFSILRSSTIKFEVSLSSKGLVSSMVNGERLLQKFSGRGIVWLAPTEPIYSMMEFDLSDLQRTEED